MDTAILERNKRITVLLSMLLVSVATLFFFYIYKNPPINIRIPNLSWISNKSASDVGSNIVGTSMEAAPEEKFSAFSAFSKPIYVDPVRLYTENRGIDLDLIEVGVEEDGKLENPDDWDVGGWYYKSAHPGEIGNIIINAHYDNNYGAPAAFWQLKNVVINDRVFLVDSLNKIHEYKVTKTFYVDINDPERLTIFEDVTDKSELTLITCGGVWDVRIGTYNKRLVVKADYVEDAESSFVSN